MKETPRSIAVLSMIKALKGTAPTADEVKDLRTLAGLTQKQAGELMGTSQRVFMSWEQPAHKWGRQMSAEKFHFFCEILTNKIKFGEL